ncbi:MULTISPECIES: sensor histidine kinase [unclassified Modicisalibacter]|uniref:sensor histidine kinase n=1 Tax=unclassified Modicisalibacter TaxID=2679913 RepID=UPI001CCC537E|nr:sensor histidine kinase N-terminal domain-containing protein [Modicisalibacter sp. R2A 31.J]MBZ9576001.1 sensor histidine kinase N-terminal domain-containing protein [Modicisalibacter sp. MOD 31.J]
MIEVTGSLKSRLALWLLVTVSGLGALLLLEAYFGARNAAQRAFDSQLEAAGLTIAEGIQWQGGQPVVKIPAAALSILATHHQERVFYAVLDARGETITADLDFSVPAAWQDAAAQRPVWRNARFLGADWRLHGRELESAGWQTQDPVQIWVGHTLSGRRALAHELFERSVSRFLAMVLLAGVLMLLAMRAALTPMRRLRHLLRQRTAEDMRPLDARVPEELRELAETLDTLFARQRDSHDALLRFTADASHQLKTPLAGLQHTSELALEERSPEAWHEALTMIHRRAADTSRLASQLLSLARLRHLTGHHETQCVELATLVRDTLLESAASLAARDHDLGLAPLPEAPTTIRGEPWALRELLGNLIDNALRYTPAGTTITVRVKRDAESVELVVEDDGPGVPTAWLGRLHQPFERGGRQDTEGSGLGLAIVHSIALRHAAELSLEAGDQGGLRARLRFPFAATGTTS